MKLDTQLSWHDAGRRSPPSLQLFRERDNVPAVLTIATMTEIFTIGYEGTDLAAFLRRLKSEGVSTLVDVRELPLSRRKGFSKNQLAAVLPKHGIEYRHSRQLGAPREIRHELRETGDYKAYFHRFNAYLQTQHAALERLAQECVGAVALMCYEREPKECHRSAVARELGRLTDVDPVHLDVGGRLGSIQNSKGVHPRQGLPTG